MTTYDQFFRGVLKGCNITPLYSGGAALRAMAVVSVIEGRNHYFNPWNIIAPPGSGGNFNDAGVQMYGSATEGIAATVAFLKKDRWRWVREGLAFSAARTLILRQFEVEYATWNSHPPFYDITTEVAEQRRAAVMVGP